METSGFDMGLELEVVIVLVGEGILLESFKLNKAQAFSLSCGLLLAIRLLFEFVLFVKAEAAEVAAIFDVNFGGPQLADLPSTLCMTTPLLDFYYYLWNISKKKRKFLVNIYLSGLGVCNLKKAHG